MLLSILHQLLRFGAEVEKWNQLGQSHEDERNRCLSQQNAACHVTETNNDRFLHRQMQRRVRAAVLVWLLEFVHSCDRFLTLVPAVSP